MEQKIARQLNWYYYGMMVLALVAMVAMYLLVSKGTIAVIDTMSTAGKVIQYIVIFDALITIPLGLYGFKRVCDKIRSMDNEELKFSLYRRYAAIRIVMVSNAMLLGIIAFYWLGCYRSMLWVAAIAAISWYFTKPTARKIQIELAPKQDNEETY